MANKKRNKIQNIPLQDVKPGPIRHKKGLTPLLEELARAIFAKVGHFVYPTFEQWELGLVRDKYPWQEILIWEAIARTFDLYVAEHPEAADSQQVACTIASISMGQVSENETEKELHKLFIEASKKQWAAPPGEPFEFSEGQAVVLQYEDIVDQWDGAIHPNLRRHVDPRRVLADADIIVVLASNSKEYSCIYGRDHLEDGGIPWGFRTLVVRLDAEKVQELEKFCAVVQAVKGRYDCP